jgi:hypothetical protein
MPGHRHRGMRPITASLVVVGLLLAGCGDDDADVGTGGTAPAAVPDRAADLVGTVASVTPFVPVTEDCVPAEDGDPDDPVSDQDPPVCTPADNDVVGTVLVEEQPGVQEGRKISYTITKATAFGGVDGFADLADGQVADTWATGPCAESYPEQCTLEAIRVTG